MFIPTWAIIIAVVLLGFNLVVDAWRYLRRDRRIEIQLSSGVTLRFATIDDLDAPGVQRAFRAMLN